MRSPGTVCVAGRLRQAARRSSRPADAGAAHRGGLRAAALQVSPVDGRLLINATITDRYDTQPAVRHGRRSEPRSARIAGADALVGGSSAVNLDIQDASRHDRNLIIPIVLLVILIVLGAACCGRCSRRCC